MTSRADRIHQALQEAIAPLSLSVIDDSAKHAGHAGARPGGQTHYTVNIVSEYFRDMNAVARHRAVYAVLQPMFDEGLHALAIDAKTPEEVTPPV